MNQNHAGRAFANQFARVREPVMVIDEYGQSLYENPFLQRLRRKFGLPIPADHHAFAPIRTQIIALLQAPLFSGDNDPLRVRHHLIDSRWLVSVSPVPRSLAVLHAVFVIRLVRWRRLQCHAPRALRDTFNLTAAEEQLVAILGSSRSRNQITQLLQADEATALEQIRVLYAKLGIESRSELWDMLHGLLKQTS